MAKKLYALRNVPEDEIDEMRALLRQHDIDFHETDAGFFGIATAAIWVNQPQQFEQAQALIRDYQQQRYHRARSDYEARVEANEQTRFIDLLFARPGKIIVYLLFALILIAIMTLPYWL